MSLKSPIYFLPYLVIIQHLLCGIKKKIKRDKNLIKASLKGIQQKSVDNGVVFRQRIYFYRACFLKKKLYQPLTEAFYVSGKLPTYPSPKLTFCPK